MRGRENKTRNLEQVFSEHNDWINCYTRTNFLINKYIKRSTMDTPYMFGVQGVLQPVIPKLIEKSHICLKPSS